MLAVGGDDDDDVYIMLKCLSVCMYVHVSHVFAYFVEKIILAGGKIILAGGKIVL